MDKINDNSHRWIWPIWLDLIIVLAVAVIMATVVSIAIIFVFGDGTQDRYEMWTDGLIGALISIIIIMIIAFVIFAVYGSDRNSTENRHEPGDGTQVSLQQRKSAAGDTAEVHR